MEIINNLDFATPILCIQSASDREPIHPLRRDFDGSETQNATVGARLVPTD